jgi:cytochrome c
MRKLAYWTCSAGLLVGSIALAADDKKGDPAKGKEVFEQCGVCHNTDTVEKKMGPGLKGLFAKAKMVNGKAPTEPNVRAKINEGGNGMPAYADMLTDAEKTDLIAYLKTL